MGFIEIGLSGLDRHRFQKQKPGKQTHNTELLQIFPPAVRQTLRALRLEDLRISPKPQIEPDTNYPSEDP